MGDAWDERKRGLEEEYFHRKEKEAIEKLRAKRAAQAAAGAVIHCPKCEGTLIEVVHEDVHIDRCDKCGGVWLDSGELEELTRQGSSEGWLGRMWKGLAGE
ncbi:MAG TPA: zf-TFIIB domain-containing protein [Blastocatellia bacterium]|nr:zf-TFIIB domain-containing protein [Blastocatellia bacterium]